VGDIERQIAASAGTDLIDRARSERAARRGDVVEIAAERVSEVLLRGNRGVSELSADELNVVSQSRRETVGRPESRP
jgi:hypothetical protein